MPKVRDESLLNDIMLVIQELGIEILDQSSEDKIKKQFDITRERIRKIEAKALRKLRKKKDDPDEDPETV
jgi:DNA-directed RNA polymerase sigma subunit (sigma70/sigma32)